MMDKQIIGILLTIIISIMGLLFSEILKINILITIISAIIIFIILLIVLIGYYVKQINERIENNLKQINIFKKDLNIRNTLIKLEKDVEWLKKTK